jgi:uncharacterized protein with GYD domain
MLCCARLDGRLEEDSHAYFCCADELADQGVRNVKETVGRAEAFKEMARKSGVTVKGLYYDVVACARRRTTRPPLRYL